MKNIEEKNRKFFNRIAKWYDVSLFRKINERIIERVVRLINVKHDSKILDAGCGTGILLEIFYAEEKKLGLYGIDISEKMIKIAKNKLGNNANLSLQSVEGFDFNGNDFDYVFSIDAFHHYTNQKIAISNFYRILKRGGEFIVVDFSFGKIGNWIFHHIEPGNNKMHTASEFKQLFREHNFLDIQQKKVGIFSILTKGIK